MFISMFERLSLISLSAIYEWLGHWFTFYIYQGSMAYKSWEFILSKKFILVVLIMFNFCIDIIKNTHLSPLMEENEKLF